MSIVISIRSANTIVDFESMSSLAQKLAQHHGEDIRPDPQKLLDDVDWFSAAIASVDGVDIGYVGWHKLYSCQSADRSFEMQNLYVEPEYRGQLVAVKLVLEVAQNALENNATIALGVYRDNNQALEFYKKLGFTAVDRNGLWRCKWSEEKIREFASWANDA